MGNLPVPGNLGFAYHSWVPDTETMPETRRRLGAWSAVAAGLAIAWVIGTLMPWGLPAWPAVTLGAIAVWLARSPGPALSRAIGAFFGLIAVIAGAGKIAALWGLAEILTP
jgi:hypothetical protein